MEEVRDLYYIQCKEKGINLILDFNKTNKISNTDQNIQEIKDLPFTIFSDRLRIK